MATGFSLNIPQEMLQRLDIADEKLQRIGATSEQVQRQVVQSFQQMKTQGVDAFIASLNQANAAISNLSNSATSNNAIATIGNSANSAQQSVTSLVQSITRLTNTQLERLSTQQGNLMYRQEQNELKRLLNVERERNRELTRQNQQQELEHQRKMQSYRDEQRELRRLANAYRQLPSALSVENVSALITRSQSAQTINQRLTAIRNLKNALRDLDVADSKYESTVKRINAEIQRQRRELSRLGVETDKVQQKKRNLMNIADQLRRRLALVFSVSQIVGYINKLIQVRGEFELQRRSLEAIIQNRDQADKLWQQTVDLAVKSPFRVKELVTYTKQLTAYRIETSKLHETTRMLSDVSAGLGVDMQRLILAYGQVKAANYLRGCLGKGTLIKLYNDDYKEVENIVVGDILMGDDDTQREVREIIRGREQMYLIKQGNYGDDYRVNENHILTLWDSYKAKVVDIYVKDYIANKDQFLGIKRESNGKYYTYPIDIVKDKIDNYYGFVIDGNKRFQLGDGTITHNTELRQFSEAGINILGELAKYFSEIENRAISVGDVFERVSKRMVSFQDVEQIFKRITSEGGIFYNMQEIQSKTLQGMISNLRDSVDLMIDDIGQANDANLKSGIDTIRKLVENWREVAWVLDKVLVLATGYIVASKLINLGNKEHIVSLFAIEKGTHKVNIAQKLWKGTLDGLKASMRGLAVAGASMALTALVGVIIDLIRKATQASREARVLAKELNQLYTQDVSNFERQVDGFTDLVTRLEQANRGSANRREIISQLNSQYGEYLNFVVNETTSIEQLKNAYDGVVESMRNKAALATFEKGIAKIDESYGENLIDAKDAFEKMLTGFVVQKDDGGDGLIPTKKEIEDLYNLLQQKIRTLNVEQMDDLHEQQDIIQSIIKAYYGEEFSLRNRWSQGKKFSGDIDLINILIKRKEQEKRLQDDINGAYKETLSSKEANLELEKEQNKYNEKRRVILDRENTSEYEKNKLLKELEKEFEFAKIDIKVKYKLISAKKGNELKDAIENWETPTVKSINEAIKELAGDNYADELIDAILVSKTEQEEGLSSIIANTKSSWELYKGIYEEAKKLGENGLVVNEQSMQEAEKMKQLYELRASILGIDLEPKTTNNTKDYFTQRLQVVNELIKAYEELKKTFSDSESLQLAFEKNKYAFAEAFAGTSLLPSDFADLTAQEFLSHFNFTTIEGIEDFYNKLKILAKNKSDKIKVDLAKGEYETNIKVEAKTEIDDKLIKDVESAFSGYELSLELQKMEIPNDLAKKFFDIDTFTLPEIKTKLISLKPQFEGEDMLNKWQEFLNKINEMEKEESINRLKTYVSYLRNTYSESVKLKLEEARQLAEIDKMEKFDDTEKEIAKQGVKNKFAKDLQKQQFEDFKNSDLYTLMFEDVEYLGDKAISLLITKLGTLKQSLGDLDASEVKEIVSQMSKLENVLSDRNPFSAIDTLRTKLKDIESEEDLQIKLINYQDEIDTAKQIIDSLDLEIANAPEGVDLSDLKNRKKDQLDIIDQKKKSIALTKEDLLLYVEYRRTLNALSDAWGEIGQNAESMFESTKQILTSLGVSSDSLAMSLLDSSSNLTSLIVSAVQFSLQLEACDVAANSALGVVGWIAMGIQAIAMLISSIIEANDKALKKQVDKAQKVVETLEKSYNKLQSSMSDAFSIEQLESYNRKAKETLRLAILNQEKAMEAQRKRVGYGKEDSDVQKEYEDMQDKLEELQNELTSWNDGIRDAVSNVFKSIKSDADAFVDAWYDSFNEIGNGLVGIEEQYRDTLLNLVKQQASLQIAGVFLDRWKEYLGAYISDNDLRLTSDEAKLWAAKVKAELPELSEQLNAFFGSFDGILTNTSGKLSELKEGIQGISESTADVIAAYLNSLRFFVADSNTKLTTLLNSFVMEETPNPILKELRIHTNLLNNIRDLFTSVIGSGHPTLGGGYIKVAM